MKTRSEVWKRNLVRPMNYFKRENAQDTMDLELWAKERTETKIQEFKCCGSDRITPEFGIV